jgi:hypothetical protein
MYFIGFICCLVAVLISLLFISNQLPMNAFNLKQANLSSIMLCSLFGHKIITTRKVTNYFREYQCSICGLELTNDVHGHKIFMTPELKNINEVLNRLYIKKQYSV